MSESSQRSSSTSSLRLLGVLVAVVVAASGWLWGLKYKRIADGNGLSVDEKHLIELQDKLDHLFQENEALAGKLDALTGESEPLPEPKASGSSEILVIPE